MAKACVKVELLWLVFKKINLMYMAEMQKQKSNFGEKFWNAKVIFGSYLHIFVYTKKLQTCRGIKFLGFQHIIFLCN